MSALSRGDDPSYLTLPFQPRPPHKRRTPIWCDWGHQKSPCYWCGFLYQEVKPLFSLVRLNSYHGMLLDGMFREVEIHMRWQSLTSEPFQRAGFGCCGSSQVHKGGKRGNFKENGSWSFWISSMVFGKRIFVLTLEKIICWWLGWEGSIFITYQLWAHSRRGHSYLWCLNPYNYFAG